QQAGLFGGPLFTLLKPLTALKLADQASRDHKLPAVAIFWIDAEDHDWNEVRSCTVFDSQYLPRSIALPPRTAAEPAPVASLRLDNAVLRSLDELEAALAPTEFRAPLLAQLRRAYVPGASL